MIRILRFSLIVTLVVLAACQTAPSVTVEDLSGIWQLDGSARILQLNEDGTFRSASSKYLLEDSPYNVGQFQLEGTLFTLTNSEESRNCPGRTGTFEVELTEEGKLQFTLNEDECHNRGQSLPRAPWSRFSP